MNDEDVVTESTRAWGTAWSEGVSALSVAVSMRSCISALEALAQSDDPVLETILFAGLVVVYARAFEAAVHHETKIARSFQIKGIEHSHFNRAIHDALLEFRDQHAHSKHQLNDFNLTFLQATLNAQYVGAPEGVELGAHLIGTRARATMVCAPATPEVRAAMLAHMHALQETASQRLADAIVAYDLAVLTRLKLGVAKPTPMRSLTLPPGPALVTIDETDLLFSHARQPDALPVEMLVQSFHLVLENGIMRLVCNGQTGVRPQQSGTPRQA